MSELDEFLTSVKVLALALAFTLAPVKMILALVFCTVLALALFFMLISLSSMPLLRS